MRMNGEQRKEIIMKYKLSGANFYIARTKAGLIEQLRPTWKGLIKDLKAMEIPQMKAIVIRIRNEQIGNLIKKPKPSDGYIPVDKGI